jgi:ankyrin repeat protein
MVNYDGETPINIAARYGKFDIIKFLVEYVRDDDIYKPNKYGDTPIHVAAHADQLNIVKYLVKYAEEMYGQGYDYAFLPNNFDIVAKQIAGPKVCAYLNTVADPPMDD